MESHLPQANLAFKNNFVIEVYQLCTFPVFLVHVLRKPDVFSLYEDWKISGGNPVVDLNRLYASESGPGWWARKCMSVH